MNIEAKTVDESRVETVRIVRPNHLNEANRLFGGILMQWIDEVAGIVAKRHSMSNVTTASVDNLTFLHGAYQNEMVVIKGKLTWVGSSSMEVCVDTYVENHLGERRRINSSGYMAEAKGKDSEILKKVHESDKFCLTLVRCYAILIPLSKSKDYNGSKLLFGCCREPVVGANRCGREKAVSLLS